MDCCDIMESFSILFIFVEGNDDEEFFKRLLNKFFFKEYSQVVIKQYQQKPRSNINKKISEYYAHPNQDYIFIRDLDSDFYSSKNEVISKCIERYNNLSKDITKIFIVEDEIESWYLAGIDEEKFYKDIKIPKDTTQYSKEKCEELLGEFGLNFCIDFRMECFKAFNYTLAMERNSSFKYFMDKLNLSRFLEI